MMKANKVLSLLAGAAVLNLGALHAAEPEKKKDDKTTPRTKQLGEVQVTAGATRYFNKQAFNATAVDAQARAGENKSLADIVATVPGVKLRETGGVGADMQLSIDGFTGRHVKVFIDGMPQEGTTAALQLNNLPVDYAQRIEVYRGVVPVGFGADALGGAINIVTPARKEGWHTDASYTMGSFHTHKSSVRTQYKAASGWWMEAGAFQNYSQNDYHINTYVTEFGDDGVSENTDKSVLHRVKRFNDTYHNESVTLQGGLAGRPWADNLGLSFQYAHFYKEIQNGVRQEIVFGDKHRKGFSFSPRLEYRKRNLWVNGLEVSAQVNFNYNETTQIDTASVKYNWWGESKPTGTKGEQSYLNNIARQQNYNGLITAIYRLGHEHTFTFNHTSNAFRRDTRSLTGSNNKLADYTVPKISRKNISGLSYRWVPLEAFNVTGFVKSYLQYNEGSVSTSDDGVGGYTPMHRTTHTLGWGGAATWLSTWGMQVKASYEKACRLPSTDELFGDEDLEAGKTDLRPESSHNYNLGVSYNYRWHRHAFHVEASGIYRYTYDYIKRGLDKVGDMNYGIYENHGRVKTTGYNLSASYLLGKWWRVGGAWNEMNARDDEPLLAGGTQQASATHGQRIPNQPYRYGSWHSTLTWPRVLGTRHNVSLTYDGSFQEEFPLYWERFGDAQSKLKVPRQVAHNLMLNLAFKGGVYSLTLEAKNITDAALYDNYSLQKAGRAFYAKVRVSL